MPRVAAVIASYHREPQLARALASLATEQPELVRAIVVDNGRSPAVAEVVAGAPLPVEMDQPERNLGCGGGVARGLVLALRDPTITHAWILDDDACATPGALPALLAALDRTGADAATPLVTDRDGVLGWYPGPLPEPAWREVRRPRVTPAQFREKAGAAPLPWVWSPWTALLVTRAAVERVGLPRDDFGFQGEDLEWTLRISASGRGVLAPAAVCQHLPPAADDPEREAVKRAMMLHNAFYTASRLRHGRRLARHLPGNSWRLLRGAGWRPRGWKDFTAAFWWGLILGRPAGAGHRGIGTA